MDVELLIQMGEYKPGGDAITDKAVRKFGELCDFLRQDERVLESASECDARMHSLLLDQQDDAAARTARIRRGQA